MSTHVASRIPTQDWSRSGYGGASFVPASSIGYYAQSAPPDAPTLHHHTYTTTQKGTTEAPWSEELAHENDFECSLDNTDTLLTASTTRTYSGSERLDDSTLLSDSPGSRTAMAQTTLRGKSRDSTLSHRPDTIHAAGYTHPGGILSVENFKRKLDQLRSISVTADALLEEAGMSLNMEARATIQSYASAVARRIKSRPLPRQKLAFRRDGDKIGEVELADCTGEEVETVLASMMYERELAADLEDGTHEFLTVGEFRGQDASGPSLWETVASQAGWRLNTVAAGAESYQGARTFYHAGSRC